MQLIVNTDNAKRVKNINDLLLLSYIENRIVPGYNKIILNYLAVQKQLNMTKCALSTACKHISNIYGIDFGKNQIIVYLQKEQLVKQCSLAKPIKQAPHKKRSRRHVDDFSEEIQAVTLKVLDFLNQLTESQHKINVKNCELIQGALKQGYDEKKLITLIGRMYTVWHTTSYAQYLVLSTLLKPEHLDDYLNKPLNGQHIPRNLRKMLPKYGLTVKRNNIVPLNENGNNNSSHDEALVGY